MLSCSLLSGSLLANKALVKSSERRVVYAVGALVLIEQSSLPSRLWGSSLMRTTPTTTTRQTRSVSRMDRRPDLLLGTRLTSPTRTLSSNLTQNLPGPSKRKEFGLSTWASTCMPTPLTMTRMSLTSKTCLSLYLPLQQISYLKLFAILSHFNQKAIKEEWYYYLLYCIKWTFC